MSTTYTPYAAWPKHRINTAGLRQYQRTRKAKRLAEKKAEGKREGRQ